jgi:hypothetical protein
VAEKLRFDQLVGDGRAVHLHERLIAPGRERVDGTRDHFLAGAVLTHDEDTAVRRRRRPDLAAELDDRGAGADDLVRPLDALAEQPVLPLEPCVLEGALDDQERLFEGQGLLDKVVGPELRGLHRRLDRAMAGDHHDRQLGPLALELGEHLEAVHLWQPDVQHHQVRHLLADPCQGLPAGRRSDRPVSLVGEDPGERRADAALVVDDQDALARHGSSSRFRPGSPAAAPPRRPGRPSGRPVRSRAVRAARC